MAKWPYDTPEWRDLRKRKLESRFNCEHCIDRGKVTRANVVDHVVAISQGGDPFPPLAGLRSLCAPCHNAKTARGAEAGAVRTSKPRKGCNPDGTPLDSAHPWSAINRQN